MNLVDTSGWIEYFFRGPNALFFAAPIEDASALIVPSVCIYEVSKKLYQVSDSGRALDAITLMKQGLVVPFDDSLALEASLISINHKMHMADSIIFATALAYDAVLWTQDAHFSKLSNVRMPENRL